MILFRSYDYQIICGIVVESSASGFQIVYVYIFLYNKFLFVWWN